MKKILCLVLSCLLVVASIPALALGIDYGSLTDQELQELIDSASEELESRQGSTAASSVTYVPVTINQSPDKYTWYMKDYVGKNVASFAYTSLGGDRLDRYGEGLLELIFITNDGIYVDIDDEDVLKQYVVTGQSIEPNTEIKLTFQKDSKGKEYSNLIDYQNIEQIVLSVKKVGMDDAVPALTAINASPDKYTCYIRDYVGRNLASCGYTSLGGDRLEAYGNGHVEFVLVTNDGSYVDIDDKDQLKLYVVTGQSIKPNTKMKMTYQKDSKGIEYSNLIDSQTIEEIELYVRKLDIKLVEAASVKPKQTADTEEATEAEDDEGAVTASKAPLDNDTHASGDFTYVLLQDGTVKITGYSGNDSSISISSEIDNYEITAIGDSVFENCTDMKSITIWADLTSIGNSAFKGCSNLKDISIPSSTTFIGDHVLEDCSSLKTVIIWGDITSIGDSAFKGCTELDDVSIPSSCKIIGESAFEGCIDLESVILWGGEIIGNSAFRGCTSLEDISIPPEVTTIGESAFEGCIDLESVILWGGETIGNSAFRGCISLVEISIPPEVTTIGDYAFEGCTSLKSVIVWGNKTSIGNDAFANCPNLKRIPK